MYHIQISKTLINSCIANKKRIPDSIVFQNFPRLIAMEEKQLLTQTIKSINIEQAHNMEHRTFNTQTLAFQTNRIKNETQTTLATTRKRSIRS